jgi:hypothetical protein
MDRWPYSTTQPLGELAISSGEVENRIMAAPLRSGNREPSELVRKDLKNCVAGFCRPLGNYPAIEKKPASMAGLLGWAQFSSPLDQAA